MQFIARSPQSIFALGAVLGALVGSGALIVVGLGGYFGAAFLTRRPF